MSFATITVVLGKNVARPPVHCRIDTTCLRNIGGNFTTYVRGPGRKERIIGNMTGDAACRQIAMRKIILELSVSRDGFIEGPNGELDWLVFNKGTCNPASFLSAFDTIFYGRKAYERFGVLPPIDDRFSQTERVCHHVLYGMRKYVFSRTKKHVAGNGMVVTDNLEWEVRRIREEEGKDILFCGGADILNTFARLDLIDEYVIAVHPVTLHSGKPLFEGNKCPFDLTLIDEHHVESGLVILHYLPQTRLNNGYHARSF